MHLSKSHLVASLCSLLLCGFAGSALGQSSEQSIGRASPAAQAPQSANLGKTPSHVYQVISTVLSETTSWRISSGVKKALKEPGQQSGKNPFQVYAKGIEVLDKLHRMQVELGMETSAVPQIPLRAIAPKDVYALAETVLVEVRRTKEYAGVLQSSPAAPYVGKKTPSDVYEQLWRVSSALDALGKPIQPSSVYKKVIEVRNDMVRVSQHLGVSLPSQTFSSAQGKTPHHVNLEAYKTLYRIASLQRSLGMSPVHTMDFPAGEIRPSDVFDVSNTLLAELARIKVHLKMTESSVHSVAEEVAGKTPNDVWMEMRYVYDSVSVMAATAQKDTAL